MAEDHNALYEAGAISKESHARWVPYHVHPRAEHNILKAAVKRAKVKKAAKLRDNLNKEKQEVINAGAAKILAFINIVTATELP